MTGFNLRWLLMIALIYVAAVADISLAPHLALLGAPPIFLLILLPVFGMTMPRSKAMFLGFAIGLIQGCLVGSDVQHFIAGAVIAGFMVGTVLPLGLDESIGLCAVLSVATTLVAGLIHVFLAPPPHVSHAILDTLLTAMYNGVLAVPAYALVRKLTGPKEKLAQL